MLNQFRANFKLILGLVLVRKPTSQNWTNNDTHLFVLPGTHPEMATDCPKVVHGQGLGSNLLYQATLNDSLTSCQAFTLFVNESRFGQNYLR